MRDHTLHNTRRRGAVALVGVLALSGGLLTACSGSDDAKDESTSDTRETTTTTAAPSGDVAREIGERLAEETGLQLEVSDALCFGDAMVEGFGEDRALEVFESDDDLDTMPEEDQDVIKAAFNDCVPGSTIAADITTEFYSSAGATSTPDDATITCVAGAVEGKAGDLLFESLAVDSDDAMPVQTIEALETCVPIPVRAELFAAGMTGSGLPQEQIDCISTALAEEFSLQDLTEIENAETISPDFEARIEAASSSCG